MLYSKALLIPFRGVSLNALFNRSLPTSTSLLRNYSSNNSPRTRLPSCSNSDNSFARISNNPSNDLIRPVLATSDVFKCFSTNTAVNRLSQAKARRERAASSRSKPLSPESEEENRTPTPPIIPSDAVTVTASEASPSELQVANAFDHPALIITRPIEWGTVILGYEQANRYTVYNEQGQMVAQIAEEVTGLGNAIGRQLLRTHRSFTATVFSADGQQVLFRVKRPAYLVNSSMFIEDGTGRQVGELHQRFHVLKRNYDLYLEKKQFATIEGSFLAWDFELKDEKGGVLAYIDRNFQGFGKEIFTDAGKYVIHFGSRTGRYPHLVDSPPPPPSPAAAAAAASLPAAGVDGVGSGRGVGVGGTAQMAAPLGAAAPLAPSLPSAGSPLIPTPTSPTPTSPTPASPTAPAAPTQEPGVFSGLSASSMFSASAPALPEAAPAVIMERRPVARPMELSERLMSLACAIAIDYDYFSQHSSSGGWMPMPIIIPGSEPSTADPQMGGAAEGAAAGAAGSATNAGASAAAGSSGGDFSSSIPSSSSSNFGAGTGGDMNLGNDKFGSGGDFGGSVGEGGDSGFKWDDLTKGAEEAAGESEEGGGIMGIAKTIFGAIFGDPFD